MFGRNAYYSFLLLPALLLMFSGCEAPVETGPDGVPEMTEQDYQKWLGHASDEESPVVLGDILLIYHEETSDINGIFWVNPGVGRDPVIADVTVPGSIRPGELGDVVVVNKTPGQVKTELEGLYQANEREVNLQVKNLRNCILVVGEFKKPGLYELSEVKTFEEVIEGAEGFSKYADTTVISVFRKVSGAVERVPLNYKQARNEAKAYEVQPGDRITVLRKIDYSTN